MNKSQDDFVELGSKLDSIQIEEVSLDLKIRQIETVQLKLIEAVEDKAKDKTMWKINIYEKGKVTHIERSFSDFEWLFDNLKANDIALFLPSLGKGSFETYLKTKWFKDSKVLKLRQENLERLLRKIEKKAAVLNSKVFQIFSSETYIRFQTYKTKHQREKAPQGTGIFSMVMGVKDKVLSMITSDSELSIRYKQRFSDIEQYLMKVIKSFTDILESHTEYLNALKEFLPDAVAEDIKYNEQLERLQNILLLFKEQVNENKTQAARERNRQEFDRFKEIFEQQLAAYKQELTVEIKKICEELSDLNVRSAKIIQASYNQNFTIDL